MKQANQTPQKELISFVVNESTTEARSVPKMNDLSKWSGASSQDLLASIFVPCPLSPFVPLIDEPHIQTFHYFEERETGSIWSENECNLVQEGSADDWDNNCHTRRAQLDGTEPKSFMNMLSSFINSYTDAQLEAEKRELPPLYTVHEAWTNDVAFMNDKGISIETARPAPPRRALPTLAQRSLEQTAKDLEEKCVAPDHDDTVVGFSATFDKINHSSTESPARAVVVYNVGSYSNNAALTSSLHNEAYGSVQKTWAACAPEGGVLEAGLDSISEVLVFPEKHIPLPCFVTCLTKRTSRPKKVEGDLLDDIFEHPQSQLCITSLPDLVEAIEESLRSQQGNIEVFENQQEDHLVGNSFAGSSPEIPESDESRKLAPLGTISCSSGEFKVHADDNHEEKPLSSDFTPEPMIIVVAPWREETKSFDEKIRSVSKKRGFLGRISARRGGKLKTAR